MANSVTASQTNSSSESTSTETGDRGVEYRIFSLRSPLSAEEILSVPPVVGGKVVEYATILDEARIRFLAQTFNFPLNAEMIAPRPEDRASAPPVGFVTIYEDSLRSGLRLPLPAPFAELQTRLGLALGQIMPNAFRQATKI